MKLQKLQFAYNQVYNHQTQINNNSKQPQTKAQNFALPQDSFVKSPLTTTSIKREGAPCNVSFQGAVAYVSYEFEQVFTKAFFKKLLRERIPDAYSDITLIPFEEVENLKNMEYFNKKGTVAIKALKKYKDSMFPIEKQIFTILENLAKKHPTLNLQELLQLKFSNAEQILINQQSEILNKINMISRKLPQKEFQDVRKLINSSFNQIFSQNPTPEERFSRKIFLCALKKLEITDRKVKSKIISIAEQLPQSTNSVNAFIVKYSQPYKLRFNAEKNEYVRIPRTSQEIAERLLDPSLGTDEHIHPQKAFKKEQEARLNGDTEAKELSTLRVKILTSKKINNEKSDTPLDVFIQKGHSSLPQHIEKHIDKLIQICDTWYKLGKVEDAKLLRDYITVLDEEFSRRSNIISLNLEQDVRLKRLDKRLKFCHRSSNNSEKARARHHIARQNGASNNHSEQYVDNNGNLVENRKVQRHYHRFSK